MTERTYTVGYAKPPAEHQFKPGRSGNPRGRPKGATGFQADLAEALGARITVKDGSRRKKITVAAAALKRLIHKAVVDGELRAIERLLVLAQHAAPATDALPAIIAAEDQALIDDFVARHRGEGQ